MHDIPNHSAGLFALGAFLLIALTGALYIEYRLHRRMLKETEHG